MGRHENSQLPDDCSTCGACCVNHEDDKWIEVTKNDADLLPSGSCTAGDVHDLCMVQDASGRCCKLVGEVGKQCSCSVYPDRPIVCQQVSRGGIVCFDSIRRYRRFPGKS